MPENDETTSSRRRATWIPAAAVVLWVAVAVVIGSGLDTLRTNDGLLAGPGPAAGAAPGLARGGRAPGARRARPCEA
ncbi:MAG: hypothetical protein ACO38A_01755, partial [Ilumatobacteraceae bacterium]